MNKRNRLFRALSVAALTLLATGMAAIYANAGENRVSQMEFRTLNQEYIKLEPTNYCTPILENSKGKLHMQELDNAWKTYPDNPELQKWWEKDALCVVTDNDNGRFNNTDEFTVNYPSIGDLEGRKVGCRITFSYIAATASTNAGWNTEKSHVILVRSENGQVPLGTACLYNGFVTRNIESCNVEYDFYFTDTGDSISMKGSYMTFGSLNGPGGGIDAKEGVAYKSSKGSGADFYVREDTNLAYEGHTIDGTEQALVYGASNDFTDRLGSNSFTKNSVTFELDTDKPKVTVYSKLNDCWFSYASYPLFATAPGGPQKVGIAADGSEAGRFDKVNSGDVLTFEVRQQVQALNGDGGSRYQSFSLADTLPKELDYQEAYVVNKDAGERLDGTKVSISTEDNNKKVIATFNPDYLQAEEGGMPYAGETYALVVKAVVNGSVYGAGEGSFVNQGFSNINGTEMDAGDVPMTAAIPKLAIDKSVSKREWQVGDSVEYTVTVRQTGENATAKNVAISDLSIPQGLTLKDCTATGVEGIKVSQKGNAWTASVPSMAQGDTVTVTFHCIAKEAANGKVTTNTAKAKADNASEVQASAEVYINTASLAITKTADAYEKQVGETANYTVKVRNTKTGTVARNVVISDLSLPAGLELAGTPALSGVPNGETGTVERSGNGWAARISNLPAGQEVAVTFSCTATEAVNGKETVNTAKAKADNAAEVQDKAEAYVNTARLEAKKTASQYEHQAGDTVEYTVSIKNTAPGTVAHNVEVSDLSIPEGLKLLGAPEISGVPESVEIPVAGDKGTPNETQHKKVTKSVEKKGNGWTAKISELPANQEVKLAFSCEATEAVNGKETVNTVKAKADNGKEASHKAEVYVNTAKLDIQKSVSGYEWRVGDKIAYTVKVENTKAGTIARGVRISDITLPEGLALEGSPSVEGAPETVKEPIANDPNTPGETKETAATCNIKAQEGGWGIEISALPSGMPVTVTYLCTAGEAMNGMEAVNTAAAVADNAKGAEDTAKIWVNTPGLSLDKKADIQKVKVGDLVTYTLDVQNEAVGTLARNLVVEDRIPEEAGGLMKLQKNSIAILDSEGNLIEDAKVSVKGNAFRIETGRAVANPEDYKIWDLGQSKDPIDGGGQNPKGTGKETLLTIEYQAKVTSEEAAGESIHNVAAISCDEEVTVTDEEEVIVNGPHLDVEKSSDKKAYTTAETAQYKVTVRQTREGYKAKDVSITDMIEPEGARIVEGSIAARLNGEEIKPKSIKMADGNRGYSMETGVDLSDEDKLAVTYGVVFDETDEDGADREFTNTVSAKGSNTNEARDSSQAVVTKKDAVLAVVKKADRKEYLAGQTGTYTLQVFEQLKDAVAKGVVVQDGFDREGMRIVEGSIKVQLNGAEITPKSIAYTEDGNGYAIETGADLSFKDKLTVTYDVVFGEGIPGAEATNTATAKAENTNEDTAEYTVEVLTPEPKLSMEKKADKEAYHVGDTGTYTVSIRQTVKDAVAKQVQVEDAFAQEGASIVQDSIKVRVNSKEITPKSISYGENGGFTIQTGTDLTRSDLLEVTYAVKFDQAPKNGMAQNQVYAEGENGGKAEDEETVAVKEAEPKLSVEKKADKETYSLGETGKYAITVKQTTEYGVAKQAVVEDCFAEEGMEILEGTLEVKLNGVAITPKSAALNEAKNGFRLETGIDLTDKDVLEVSYDVMFAQVPEGGKAENQVTVKDGDGGETPGKETVTVKGPDPMLTLKKTADRQEAGAGDTVKYTLLVSGAVEGEAAQDIVLEDGLQHTGAFLKEGSIHIYDMEGKEITGDCKVTEGGHGFRAEALRALAYGESITITYEAELKGVQPGEAVKNVARASSDNAGQATAEQEVKIPTVMEEIASSVKTGLKNHAALYAGAGALLLAGAIALIRRNRKGDDGKI